MLYVGMTNSLTRRLKEHFENRGTKKSFASKHFCYNLVYFETFKYVNSAIAREKQIKRWSRSKKDNLVNELNPKWRTLNAQFHIEDD